MAKITSLVLIFLIVAAASIPEPAGAAGAVAAFASVFSKAALKKTADVFQKSKKLTKAFDIGKDIALEVINQSTDDDQLLPRRNDSPPRMVTVLGPVKLVQAGGVSFSVGGVDVTSRVTWTSRCGGGGGSQQVACGDPLCEQYGACDGGDASAAAGRVCNSVAPAGVPLHEGKIALLIDTYTGREIFSKNNAAYACRPNAAAGGNDYAVIGLGRGNDIIANLTAKLFSYTIDGDLQGTTVRIGYNVQRGTAGQAGSRTTNFGLSFGSDPNSSFYSVGITGIKVGSGEVGSEEVMTIGILTTTMPITFINPSLFDHLEQELNKAVASPVVNGSGIDARFRQLCYPSGTKLPAVTLLFVGQNAGMELQPEHYSYEESSGVLCLSILPSPWSSGLSIIGSMVQAGRRMTYDLDDNTLTFDSSVSASAFASSKPLPSPSLSPSSSSSVSQATLTPFFLSPAFAVLLLAIIM
jgi:hypothetical protein